SGNSKMVGLPNTDNSDSCLLRFLDRFVHGEHTDQLAHAIVSVDHCRHRCLKNNLRFRVPMNGSLLQSFMVADHSLHSMTLNSIQICRQQYIFDGITFFLTESEFSKN